MVIAHDLQFPLPTSVQQQRISGCTSRRNDHIAKYFQRLQLTLPQMPTDGVVKVDHGHEPPRTQRTHNQLRYINYGLPPLPEKHVRAVYQNVYRNLHCPLNHLLEPFARMNVIPVKPRKQIKEHKMEYGILGLLILIADIYAIFQVFSSRVSGLAKILWTLVIVVFPVVGFIIWLIAGPRGATVRV